MAYTIILNAKALSAINPFFRIENFSGWLSASYEHTLDLLPGHYQFGQPVGEIPLAVFEVAGDGTLFVPPGGYMTTDGRTRIDFVGYRVTLDATALSGSNPNFRLEHLTEWMRGADQQTLNLMPRSYQLGQPGGEIPAAVFEVAADGTLLFPANDFMTTDGRTRIVFAGYPVTLDATRFKHVNPNFRLEHLTEWMSTAEVHTLNLMPRRYRFGQPGGEIPHAEFDVGLDGTVTVPPGGYITTDGRTRVDFLGFRVTLDATKFKQLNPNFRLENLTNWMSTAEEHTLNLMPRKYLYGQPNGPVPAAIFEVATDGSLTVPSGSFMSTDGRSRIDFFGFPIALDATNLSAPQFRLRNLTKWLASTEVHQFNMMPSWYEFEQATGVVAQASFTVNIDGTVTCQDSGEVTGTGTNTIAFVGVPFLIDNRALPDVPLRLRDLGVELDASASMPQKLKQFMYVPLSIDIDTEPALAVEFFLRSGPSIEFDEPYPFVESGQSNGVPVLVLTNESIRTKMLCQAFRSLPFAG